MSIRKNTQCIVIMIFVVSIIACSRKTGDETSTPKQMPKTEERTIAVEGMIVDNGFLVEEIRSAGVTKGIREAWVISEAEGLIRTLHFRLGDVVMKGDVLLSVESELAAQQRDQAESQYNTALLEYQAAEQSRKSDSISALQFSQTTDKFQVAKTALLTAIDTYENTFIKAPFAGAVASQDQGIGVGNHISRGVRVARIVDYSAYQAEVSIGEGEIPMVLEGAGAKVTGSDRLTRIGRVSAVSAGSDNSTGSFTVIVEWNPLENDTLKSGMSVDIAIEATGSIDHIIASAAAIHMRSGEEFVYVDSGGIAEHRRIDTGNRLGERVEVLAGLASGEVIIISGLASLTPGVSITTTILDEKGSLDADR